MRRVRRRYHVSTAGLIYVFVTLLISLGAFNSQNNLLFWASGFSLSLLFVSGILSGAMLMGIDLERVGLDQPRVNEPGAIAYRVRNRNRFVPAFALSIVEVDRERRGFWNRLLRRVLNDRRPLTRPSSSTWTHAFPEPRAFVAHVGAGQTVITRARVVPQRRGGARFGWMLVSTSYPFGIVRKSLLFEQATDCVVHPARVTVDAALLRETIRRGERGAAPTRRSGPGAEFFSLREYRSGDGIRAVAWRASARRGDLLVRQPAAPAPVRIIVVLDLDRAADEAAAERALSVAGSLIDLACERRLEIGLTVPDAALQFRPREGRLHQQHLLDELGRIDLHADRAGPVSAASLASNASRAAIVVIHNGARAAWSDAMGSALHVDAASLNESALADDATHPAPSAPTDPAPAVAANPAGGAP